MDFDEIFAVAWARSDTIFEVCDRLCRLGWDANPVEVLEYFDYLQSNGVKLQLLHLTNEDLN